MPSRNLIAKLQGFFPVTDDLRRDLNEMTPQRVTFHAGDAIERGGEKFSGMYLVEEGWVLRARYLPGGSRQIVNFALPGDFLNYNMLMFAQSEFDLIAKTNVSLWRLEIKSFREMMARHPGLAEALVWSNAHEEALLAERVVSLGRRDATQRLAHVLCEIATRLRLIDRHDGAVLVLPLIQEDFADILGLSVIHIVRIFNRLEAAGAVSYRSKRVTLKDPEKLKRIAGFDGDYLYFSTRKDMMPIGGG
jgi:CRP-like cAMP-binding protein